MGLTVTPIHDGVAEVRGIDCAQPLDAGALAAIDAALLDYPVLTIRDQALEPSRQAAFSRQFGHLEETVNTRYAHPDDPLVLVLSNELAPDGTPLGVADAGDFLHSDQSTRVEPSILTILHARKLPPRGGDTEFVNMYRAYDALPADLKRTIAGRFAYHHVSKLKNPRVSISGERPDAAEFYRRLEASEPDVLQPVVRTHPGTGKPALYVSPRFTLRIDGMTPAESEAVLQALFAVMNSLVYRYAWQLGDLVMWDNRCLAHRATGGYALPDVRRMHRTSISGERAVLAA